MKIDVSHIAKLANLTVTEAEIPVFEKQLLEVLEYINKLDEVIVTDVEPTSQVTGLENVTREDTTQPSLTQHDALSQAKNTHDGLFVVKGVFEDE